MPAFGAAHMGFFPKVPNSGRFYADLGVEFPRALRVNLGPDRDLKIRIQLRILET